MNITAELAMFARIMEEKGFVNALEGNLSIMDRESGLTYITPSGRMKLLLTEDMICTMDPGGRQIAGSEKASSEYLLHEAVYRARPDVNAVIHCHSPYLTAYALKYRDFTPPQDCFLGMLFPRMVCLPYGEHGTHEIHRGIEEALKDSPLCLLGGHGVVCAAKDMQTCAGTLEAIENLARTLYIAQSIQ